MSRLVVVRPLPFEDFVSVVKEVAKHGNDFQTLKKVLADEDMEEVLKHYCIRTEGNFRDLDLILENVCRARQRGADAVIKRVEQWYKRRVQQKKGNWIRTISSRWQRQDPWGLSQRAKKDQHGVETF